VPDSRILLGVIGRAHGVRGLVHVHSYTADPVDLTAYGPLSDAKGRSFVLRWRGEGIAEIAALVGGREAKVADRTEAEALTNTRLYIGRERLPEPADEEFYQADLIGLTAVDGAGSALGTVVAVHDYGAGASLEIAREGVAPLLVPFTRVVVPEVDVARGQVTVTPPVEVEVASGPSRDPDRRARDGAANTRQAHGAEVPPCQGDSFAAAGSTTRTREASGMTCAAQRSGDPVREEGAPA